jgi:YHS domain-containing protein
VFGAVRLNYELFLNLAGLIVFGALIWLTARRGATDPVCGMKVDRSKALTRQLDGETYYFCSAACRERFAASAQPPASVHQGRARARSADEA